MKVSSLSKAEFRRLIMNLQSVAHELKEARQESEKQEKEQGENENENWERRKHDKGNRW